MPTSLESLRRHRAAHEGGPESARVWFFHAHVYFDHESHVDEARAFMERIRETHASNPHVEVHTFIPRPAGPHPRGSFEVLFTREAFADVLAWLMFERPPALSILIHPLTRSQTADHTSRALWLGEQLRLDRELLESVDARLIASGRSEESIIDGSKRH
jgi:DOPA 4,5-dioxygenase